MLQRVPSKHQGKDCKTYFACLWICTLAELGVERCRFQCRCFFDSLESVHNRCHKIHEYFEKDHKDIELNVLNIKLLNTVRWISRELCLKTFDQRYDIIVLEEVTEDMHLDEKHRVIAEDLHETFSRKEIIATACLFNSLRYLNFCYNQFNAILKLFFVYVCLFFNYFLF